MTTPYTDPQRFKIITIETTRASSLLRKALRLQTDIRAARLLSEAVDALEKVTATIATAAHT